MKNIKELAKEKLSINDFSQMIEDFTRKYSTPNSKHYQKVITKPPDEVKPKYLQFFAKALNCKVDDILNQPTQTPKTLKL